MNDDIRKKKNIHIGIPEDIKRYDVLYKYCLRCGRKLMSTQSKMIGYGPICYKKLETSKKVKLF